MESRHSYSWYRRLLAQGKEPKTINRRISSVSSFYKYLGAAAAELRLPITVPNPAHAQFIPRQSSDPVTSTKALTTSRARQLMNLPQGDSVIAYRDRAILRLYLYSGIRLATGCRLNVSDFHQDDGPLGHRRRRCVSESTRTHDRSAPKEPVRQV